MPLITAAAEPLQLLAHERPPFFQLENGQPTGLLAPAVTALLDAGIAKTVAIMPAKRQLSLMRDGYTPLCALGWFNLPERRQFAYFSLPVYRDRPMVLVSRSSLPLSSPVSMQDYLGNPYNQLALQDGYSYGEVLDKLIKNGRARITRTGSSNETLVALVKAGRADSALMQPEEAELMLPPPHSQLAIHTLSDGGTGRTRHWMCSLAVPLATLQAIDAALTRAGVVVQ